MFGCALAHWLAREAIELLTAGRGEFDLRELTAVSDFFICKMPQVVFLAAAEGRRHRHQQHASRGIPLRMGIGSESDSP